MGTRGFKWTAVTLVGVLITAVAFQNWDPAGGKFGHTAPEFELSGTGLPT